MGTRADFYIGTGPEAEWLGSIAYDGYMVEEQTWDDDECRAIKNAKTEEGFRDGVIKLLDKLNHATYPHQGWPWPWTDSNTTDYTYAFIDGQCKTFRFNEGQWPDMTSRQNVTFGPRSGLLILCGKPADEV